MTTKICTNSTCPAYAHFVYTLAMRCVLCRCDLMPAHGNAALHGRTDQSAPPAPSRKSVRAHASH